MGDLPLSTMFILMILILLSAFFSSAETAFSSVNRIRLKSYVDEKRRGSKNALYVTENFDKSLSTILVGNNIVNIAASAIATALATKFFEGAEGILVSTVVMTILILIFGEILPKSLAKENAESFSLRISGILVFLIRILSPVTYIFVAIKNGVTKLFKNKDSEPLVTEEEIKAMVEISEEEGVIDKEEKELITRTLEFNDILVAEVLKPRIDMVAVEVNQSVEEIRDLFLEERYSRIPVYEDNIDNIIGILSDKQFFSYLVQNRDITIRKLVRTPIYVVESMKISTLLPELQKNKSHMAIVVDEFGGTSGLITLEDILEEIVGDIWDEHDETIKNVTELSPNLYEFNAQLPLDDFMEMMDLEDDDDSGYHTLGGWIFEKFERIPKTGEQLHYKHLTITIREVQNRRINKVLVRVDKNIEEKKGEELA
ncbi:hemolysin family protein [Priestia taiwanensis]|uniref:Hemolysin n=1 Tax=Priestia taiwanensis TaxID=1347902 RepID=A0A917AU89_9BACI|nr:hemolysin family protein [Priestia taiwanensis]MBM7364267.1 CBS domain containing-hemolysin-like protein [Priestia taiwanensis]GGE73064.1 hemolysin [Priestia taiwanensis]